MNSRFARSGSAFVVLVALINLTTAVADNAKSPIHIGLFDDVGVGVSITPLASVLRELDHVYIHRLSAEQIRSGALSQIDLLIHPGGSGSRQGNQLEQAGRLKIRQFVHSGGGFMGFCAGSYLASADYSWSLHLLDAKVLDRKHWARGKGSVKIEFSEPGQAIFADQPRNREIYYGQGPLLAPADRPDIPDFQSLAKYRTEIAKNGAPKGIMLGTTAVALGTFGSGRVLCFSPHPELTDGAAAMVHQAIDYVLQSSRMNKTKLSFSPSYVKHIEQTPDTSQKPFSNSQYCAPCAVANTLVQFSNRQLVSFDIETLAGEVSSQAPAHRLAWSLGEEDFMETRTRRGTNRYRLVNGSDRIVEQIADKSLQYRYLGLRELRRRYIDEAARGRVLVIEGTPTLNHVKEHLSQGDGAIILFGSYKPDPKNSGKLQRVGGHYVAAVGYGQNSRGEADPDCLILHDSNDRHDGNKYVFARRHTETVQLWDDDRLLADCRGLIQLEGAPITKDGRIAFLETVLGLRVIAKQ